ncbi:MAG: nodulation protein NfeD [Dyella sp.]
MAVAFSPVGAQRTAAEVARIELDGPIGPAAAEYFEDALARAVAAGAPAIVLRLDTPGGLSEAMRQIITGILASKVPVLVYVAPGGARAASAGTYIMYAGHIAAMAPATHLGAATPVSLGGDKKPMPLPKLDDRPAAGSSAPVEAPEEPAAEDGSATSRKMLNDSIAYIRSLAQLRDRNVAWAEQAVRGAATLTASEALQKRVIDIVAADVPALLAQADGRQVQLATGSVTLHVKGLAVRDYPPSARTRFLAIITSPSIAYLLVVAGVLGLLLEATNPGALLPGIVGGICLLIGMYALQLLPVNYAGLALMALGVGLLVAELVHPTVGALGIGGVIAFVVGSVMLMNTGVPGYAINRGVIFGIALAAAGLLVVILRLVLRSRHSHALGSGDASMLDIHGELLEPLSADGESWMIVRGERWRVHCDIALPAGARVRVVRRQGLLLWVVPA